MKDRSLRNTVTNSNPAVRPHPDPNSISAREPRRPIPQFDTVLSRHMAERARLIDEDARSKVALLEGKKSQQMELINKIHAEKEAVLEAATAEKKIMMEEEGARLERVFIVFQSDGDDVGEDGVAEEGSESREPYPVDKLLTEMVNDLEMASAASASHIPDSPTTFYTPGRWPSHHDPPLHPSSKRHAWYVELTSWQRKPLTRSVARVNGLRTKLFEVGMRLGGN